MSHPATAAERTLLAPSHELIAQLRQYLDTVEPLVSHSSPTLSDLDIAQFTVVEQAVRQAHALWSTLEAVNAQVRLPSLPDESPDESPSNRLLRFRLLKW